MSLDERLRQKLQQVYVNFHDGKRPLSTYLEAVAQVFSDAGYIQPKEMHPLDLAHELGFMTGQEAFERLEKAGLLGHDLEIAREALNAKD